MAPSNLSPELPLELLCEIIKFLPLKGLQTLSLASRLTRSLTIPFIFGHLRYRGNLQLKIHKINQARKDLKEVIKKLELFDCEPFDSVAIRKNESLVIFQFLETLPNLQVLHVDLLSACLSPFISSIRHTALLELSLDTFGPLEGAPTAGLSGLEKLFVRWNPYGKPPNESGSSLAHLYELIRPTLTTLVELRIDNSSDDDFDLQLLKPCTDTLRTFEYTLQSADESILEAIPVILPHLTKLSIKWENSYTDHSILWKDAHIQALSKNDYLTDLELSSDFEVRAQDTLKACGDFYPHQWLVRSYKRRLKATQDIASACPRLQRCIWVQMTSDYTEPSEMYHSFIVEERMTGGNLTRVVRGIKQDWMGRDYGNLGMGIVKCKLEDLPGDIIGQNDVE